jgi:hypothetical protein
MGSVLTFRQNLNTSRQFYEVDLGLELFPQLELTTNKSIRTGAPF